MLMETVNFNQIQKQKYRIGLRQCLDKKQNTFYRKGQTKLKLEFS